LTLVGVAIPLVAMMVWMRVTSCWDAYLEIQRGFVAGYARLYLGALPVRGVRHTIEFLLWYLGPAVFAIAGGLRLSREGARPALALALGWLLAAAAGVWAQNKFFRYHWTIALPPLCMLAGAGVEWAASALQARRRLFRIAVVSLAVPVLWSAWVNGPEYAAAARRWTGRLSRQAYAMRFGLPGRGDFSYLGDRMAAEYAQVAGAPERGLFIWG